MIASDTGITVGNATLTVELDDNKLTITISSAEGGWVDLNLKEDGEAIKGTMAGNLSIEVDIVPIEFDVTIEVHEKDEEVIAGVDDKNIPDPTKSNASESCLYNTFSSLFNSFCFLGVGRTSAAGSFFGTSIVSSLELFLGRAVFFFAFLGSIAGATSTFTSVFFGVSFFPATTT